MLERLIGINSLRNNDKFKLLKHGDEGAGHWYELFSSTDPNIKCGPGCPSPARFIIYTHYHDNSEDITVACKDHASELYTSLYNSALAG